MRLNIYTYQKILWLGWNIIKNDGYKEIVLETVQTETEAIQKVEELNGDNNIRFDGEVP